MIAAKPVAPMTLLQNRWYNCLTRALQLDRTMFQIVQPAGPIGAGDGALWELLDVIPPESLTCNRSAPGALRLFDEYAPMVSQIQFSQPEFEQVIGAQNYHAWSAYLAAQRPTPADNQLPSLFRNWAARNAPGMASAGVAFLSNRVIVNSARQALAPYQGPTGKPVDFAGTYDDLLKTLRASSGRSVFFESSATSANVLDAWTGGIDVGVDGLWVGSGSASRLSRKFAAGNVTVRAKFDFYAPSWTATPGPWYNSWLFNDAFSNQTSPPWLADANPSWNDLFGPDGSMLRLLASLVVADGANISVTSDATFGATDQQTVLESVSRGVWPFYAPAIGGAVSCGVTFPQIGGMEVEVITQPGHPLVVGANVLGVARYLGHVAR